MVAALAAVSSAIGRPNRLVRPWRGCRSRGRAGARAPVQQVRRDLRVAEVAHRFVERELLGGDEVLQVGVDSAGHSPASVARPRPEGDVSLGLLVQLLPGIYGEPAGELRGVAPAATRGWAGYRRAAPRSRSRRDGSVGAVGAAGASASRKMAAARFWVRSPTRGGTPRRRRPAGPRSAGCSRARAGPGRRTACWRGACRASPSALRTPSGRRRTAACRCRRSPSTDRVAGLPPMRNAANG